MNAADLDLPYVALGHLATRIVALESGPRAINWRPVFAEIERRLDGTAEAATS